MTRGISAKAQREDRLRLRRKRLQDAAAALAGAKEPVRVVPVPTRPKRPSALRPVAPIGRESK
jgi:hypothetical protein